MEVKDEDMVALKEQVSLKDTTNKKKNEVRDERSQWREKPIIIGMEEIKDNERELEAGKQKEKEEKEKVEKIKKKKRVRVKKQEKRGKKQLQMMERKSFCVFRALQHIPGRRLRKHCFFLVKRRGS